MAAFAEGQSAAYRLFATIKRKPEIDPDDPTGKQLEDIKGDVELKDVYFSYPARPKHYNGYSWGEWKWQINCDKSCREIL